MSALKFSRSRLLAYEVLRDVRENNAYANLALQARLKQANLTEQDAAFATELTSGTLRLAGRYDAIIELATKRQISSLDAEVHAVLQLGAHQLLSLETATHAAINEQVELAKYVAGQRTAGFVNGVLRTISRTTAEEWINRVSEGTRTEFERLAAIHSHPQWIVEALQQSLQVEGLENELEATLQANNAAPRVHIAYLEGEAPPAARGLSPIGDELASGKPSRAIEDLARQGITAKVQDQGSQLAALALLHAQPVVRGESWLDLCAGPGGKTAVLASAARQGGATVRANEISQHRAVLVQSSIQGFEDVVTVVSHDGRSAEAYADKQYHRIMVDAPCSGLGALRRRPEARWRKQPEDLETLTILQLELLEQATLHLAKGGVVAYVTCSPHLAETRDIVDAHLEKHPELSELDVQEIVNGLARHPIPFRHATTASAQLWPHRDGTDAMFISLMRKTHEPSNRMTT